MKTIQLTDQDATELIMALGYANGAASVRDGEYKFTQLVDRILVQLSPENYTYANTREEVVEQLRADGINV